MKTYIDENKKECYITLDKMKKYDEWTEIIDLSELKNAINGLEMLCKKVVKMNFAYSILADFDNKYYHKYDENFICSLYKKLQKNSSSIDLTFRNNRLYLTYENKEIICPVDAKEYYDNKLTIVITYQD